MYCSQLVTHPVSNPVHSGLFNLSSALSFASHVEAEFALITWLNTEFLRGVARDVFVVLPRSACVYTVVIGAPTNHKSDKRKKESNITKIFR